MRVGALQARATRSQSLPLFSFLTSTVPQHCNSSFTAARECCSGGASFLPVRCVLLMLMTGSPRGTASHAQALKPEGEAGEAVRRVCGGRGVWTTVPSRRLNGSYSLERDVNVEPGCVLEYSKVGVRQFSEACPLNCSHVYEQLQPEIKLLSFFFLLRQISLPLCQSPSRKERGSITICASVRFFKRRLKANKFLPL